MPARFGAAAIGFASASQYVSFLARPTMIAIRAIYYSIVSGTCAQRLRHPAKVAHEQVVGLWSNVDCRQGLFHAGEP